MEKESSSIKEKILIKSLNISGTILRTAIEKECWWAVNRILPFRKNIIVKNLRQSIQKNNYS